MIDLVKKFLLDNYKKFDNKNIGLFIVVDKENYFTIDINNQKYIVRFTIHENDYVDYEKIDIESGISSDYQSIFFNKENQYNVFESVKDLIDSLLN